MRFRVTNIRPGYCEVWANLRPGGRYRKVAEVRRLDNDSWHALVESDAYDGVETEPVSQSTRRECVSHLKRRMLLAQAERAIKVQRRPSMFWHSPRRDALSDMRESGLFTFAEVRAMRGRMEVYQ